MKTERYIFEEVVDGQFGDSCFPEHLIPNKVYVCREWHTSVHLCPCGCGDKVFLPFQDTHIKQHYWGLNKNTFTPSIQKLNGCKSHYFIINGLVQWA